MLVCKLLLFSGSFAQPGKSSVHHQYEFSGEDFPSKIVNGNPWTFQATSPDKEIKDKKSQYSAPEGVIEMPKEESQPKLSYAFVNRNGPRPPNYFLNRAPINRPVNYYGRSLNATESTGPVLFSNVPFSIDSTPNGTIPNPEPPKAPNFGLQYAPLQRYGYQNGTGVGGESVRAGVPGTPPQHNRVPEEIQFLKPSLNYVDEITFANKVELNRRHTNRNDAVPRVVLTAGSFNAYPRLPRNQYTAVRHFGNVNEPGSNHVAPQLTYPVVAEVDTGGIRVVPAPNLQKAPVTQSLFEKKVPVAQNLFEKKAPVAQNLLEKKAPITQSLHEKKVPITQNLHEKATVVQSLHEKKSPEVQNSSSEDVVKSIMAMTASQLWKKSANSRSSKSVNARSPKTVEVIEAGDAKKLHANLERRSDEKETKESPKSGPLDSVAVNNTERSDKIEAKTKEAAEKMASSFPQLRFKLIATDSTR